MAVTTDLDKVQKEIAIMKKLIHPHLVRLYEVGTDRSESQAACSGQVPTVKGCGPCLPQVIDDPLQDALYMVLEYVTGGTIMEYDPDERR
jgi:serine/threonine protein kinase